MNENNNGNSNGNGTENSNDSENSEYRYSRDNIPHPSYIDANYRTDSENKGSFYTSAQNDNDTVIKNGGKEKKAGGKKKGFGKFIAACLICALLGGAVGGGVAWKLIPSDSGDSTSNGSSLNVADSTSTGSTSVPTVDGSTLTGAQIYALGCEQAVAITTEITYTNFLGMQTSSAVSGSGFIVTSDGYIVTNYHVISEAYEGGYDISVILYNGDTYDADIVGVEDDNDIAVLKIDATGLSAVTLGSSDSIEVGDTIYCIGNPLGELSFSMTTGSVSALDRDITTSNDDGTTTTNNMFQIDAAVNEGNSGGPVYNTEGQVVGIVTAKYEDTGVEGLGFAIPIDDVTDIINQLIQNGYVSGKAYLGISVQTVSSAAEQYYSMTAGAYVTNVVEGSCSDNAGIKVGDIITAIDDTEITSSSDLVTAKRKYSAGDTATLKIYRSGEYINIEVTFDEEEPESVGGSSSDSEDDSQSSSEGDTSGETSGDTLPVVPKS